MEIKSTILLVRIPEYQCSRLSFCRTMDRTIDKTLHESVTNLANWILVLLINFINLHNGFAFCSHPNCSTTLHRFCLLHLLFEGSSIAPHVLIQKIILHSLRPIGSIITIEPHTEKKFEKSHGSTNTNQRTRDPTYSFTPENAYPRWFSIMMTNLTRINLFPVTNML